jgi:hypothetical protein
VKPLESINFNAQHSPMGAFLSFTCGHFGTRGGIGVEIGSPAKQDLYIGIKDGDRHSRTPLKCLPFYRGASSDTSSTFLVEQAGPTEQNVRPNVTPFTADQIQRTYGWATDHWTTDELDFAIYSPFASIPDPAAASPDDLREALAPVVCAELVIDNTAGTGTKTAVFAIGFDAPGVRKLDAIEGFSWRDRIGFAAKLVEDSELIPVQRWDVSEAIADPNPVHQLGTCAGFAFEIPAGERRTLRIAIGCYLDGIVTTRLQGRYLYTRYFSSLHEVLSFAMDDDRFMEHRSVARSLDRQLLSSNLSPDQQFLLAHATRSYYGSTQLLEVGGELFWIVNEGEYCMMNTLDLSIDHAFWELDQNPWVVRNVLDRFIRHYSYVDDRGISFAHDMGAHNNLSPQGHSSYELPRLTGCFSYMTQEQLCNWILLAACYVAKTGDVDWLRQNQHVVEACAASMRARANPRTGIMAHDSARCEGGSEITTYDSLDTSLGQARANTYLAVKCWATWIGLEMLAELAGEPMDREDSLAEKIACSLIACVGADGVLPAVLEADSPGHRSRIIPAVEALIYPAYWLAAIENEPKVRERLSDALRHPLVQSLRRHTIALLGDREHRNFFDDGGMKLSSTSNNSWMSKIALCEYVIREILNLSEFNDALKRADTAHVRWQIEGSGYWACSDQFVSGVAKGSRYYPRLVTAALWLTESPKPVIETTVFSHAARPAPAK